VHADLVVTRPTDDFSELVLREAQQLIAGATGPLGLAVVAPEGLGEALRAAPVGLSTMGRGLDEDYAAFLYSAAAGRYAARLL
jgi:hypothetical protein